jgi:hypothetical protein
VSQGAKPLHPKNALHTWPHHGLPIELGPRPGAIISPKQHSKRPKNTPKPGSEAENGLPAVSWHASLRRVTSLQMRVTRISRVGVAPRSPEGFLGHPDAKSKLEIRKPKLATRNGGAR